MSMKKRFAFFLIASLLIGKSIAFAQETPSPELQSAAVKEGSPIERLTKLKEQLNINLDEQIIQTTVKRCQTAQVSLKKIRTNLDQIEANRLTVYVRAEARLKALKNRLLLQDYDTSSLDLVIAGYQRQLTEFKDTMNTYQQQLDDIIIVDCKTYPSLFRAGLEAARESRKNIVATSLTIKEFVKSDIKNAIEVIRQKLAM